MSQCSTCKHFHNPEFGIHKCDLNKEKMEIITYEDGTKEERRLGEPVEEPCPYYEEMTYPEEPTVVSVEKNY